MDINVNYAIDFPIPSGRAPAGEYKMEFSILVELYEQHPEGELHVDTKQHYWEGYFSIPMDFDYEDVFAKLREGIAKTFETACLAYLEEASSFEVIPSGSGLFLMNTFDDDQKEQVSNELQFHTTEEESVQNGTVVSLFTVQKPANGAHVAE